MGHEMMRAREGQPGQPAAHGPDPVRPRCTRPWSAVFREGMDAGELRPGRPGPGVPGADRDQRLLLHLGPRLPGDRRRGSAGCRPCWPGSGPPCWASPPPCCSPIPRRGAPRPGRCWIASPDPLPPRPRNPPVNPRIRILVLLAVLFVGSLGYYFLSTDHTPDLVLLGTVDANQVIVSPQVAGRIARLAVVEGQDVKAGDLVALLDPGRAGRGQGRRRRPGPQPAGPGGRLRGPPPPAPRATPSNPVASAQATRSAAAAALAEAGGQPAEPGAAHPAHRGPGGPGHPQRPGPGHRGPGPEGRPGPRTGRPGPDGRGRGRPEGRPGPHPPGPGGPEPPSADGQAHRPRPRPARPRARLGYTRIVAPISGKVGIWAARAGRGGQPRQRPSSPSSTWARPGSTPPFPRPRRTRSSWATTLEVRMPGGARVHGQGDRQGRRRGLRHPAGREPPQARHQDRPAQAADRQPRANATCPG